jgi:hypothetical protein
MMSALRPVWGMMATGETVKVLRQVVLDLVPVHNFGEAGLDLAGNVLMD